MIRNPLNKICKILEYVDLCRQFYTFLTKWRRTFKNTSIQNISAVGESFKFGLLYSRTFKKFKIDVDGIQLQGSWVHLW